MNQRQDIMSEFFQLKADLNQSNKFKDQVTKLYFEIEEKSSGRRILFAKIAQDQKLRIFEELQDESWDSVSKYEKLSEFLEPIILDYEKNKIEYKVTLNEYIEIQLSKLLGFK